MTPRAGAVRQNRAEAYGAENEALWLANWRLFFLICSEVWDLGGDRQCLVSYYVFVEPKGG